MRGSSRENPGEYTLYYGTPPQVIRGEAIEAPSRLVIVFVRVEGRNKDDELDVSAARKILAGMTVTGSLPDEYPDLAKPVAYPAKVIEEANRRMDEVFDSCRFLT